MDLTLYPGCPHQALGLGGCGLVGAAEAEPRDEPRPDPGLDAGQGQVQPWSDRWQVTPCPMLPAWPLVLPWISAGAVLVCSLLNRLVKGWVGLRFPQWGNECPCAGKLWPKVPDHHCGPQSMFVL